MKILHCRRNIEGNTTCFGHPALDDSSPQLTLAPLRERGVGEWVPVSLVLSFRQSICRPAALSPSASQAWSPSHLHLVLFHTHLSVFKRHTLALFTQIWNLQYLAATTVT